MHLFRQARVPLACLPGSAGLVDRTSALEPWASCDILVEGTKIKSVVLVDASAGPAIPSAVASTDLGGVIVWPGLLDAHTHLDKTHTWDRAPNPRGEFWDAIATLQRDAETHWTEDDIYRRANFALQSAWSHGTNALRTHLDSSAKLGPQAHAVMAQLRQEWAGKIELQTVSLCNVTQFAAGEADRIIALTANAHASALGGFPQPGPNLPAQLEYLLAAARELKLSVDLHVDESALTHAECLRATAAAVLKTEFPYPVTCGHNCSLSIHDPARAAETIALVREAGIRLITLPLCNLYLQGRQRDEAERPLTPQWRGLTRVHELMEAGLTVAAASDNVRDAFYAWGDYDMLEVFHQTVRLGHLDTRLTAAPALVSTGPATIMDLPHYGTIAPGAPADLIVTAARSFSEFLARPAALRRLIHGESFREPQSPDFSQLNA